MEAAFTANERTPLLGCGITSNGHTQLFRISAIFNEQMPLDENDTDFNEQTSLDGNGTTNEQMLYFGEETSNPDTTPKIISCSRAFIQETNEVSREEVAQALYLAWRRNRRPNRKVALNFFTTKDLYAMRLAWKNVTRGRHCSSPQHTIAGAVADAITKELLAVPQCYENDIGNDFHIHFTIEKNLLFASLLSEWELITLGCDFPVRYTETIFLDSDERPPAESGFGLRQVELYDKVHEFFSRPILQVLPNFLFFWPLSILLIGSKYMDCPMGHHLSHLLMLLGCVGCLAILFRTVLMYIMSPNSYSFRWIQEKMYSKLIEFTFLIIFVVQALYFFDIDPTAEPEPKQCVKNFYNAALLINYVSIAFLSVYVLVYFIIICQDQLNFWHWIFRYL